MKELLSIKEKARRYDEALKKLQTMRDAWNNLEIDYSPKDVVRDIEYYFPELKESKDKDKEIRMSLINYIKAHGNAGDFTKEEFIAYIEKQRGQDDLQEMLKTAKQQGYKEGLRAGRAEIWKQIEKQGEQKPLIIPKFRVGDIITPNGKKEYYTITDIVDGWYEFKEKHVNGGIPIHYQFGWELVEQKPQGKSALEAAKEEKVDNQNCVKPADNVEPKFKVGDWLIHNKNIELANSLMIVTGKNNDEYLCRYMNGQCSYNIKFIDKEYKLWTIQDAKDGDVLSYVDEENLWIMIYRSLYEPYEGHVHYHALLVNNNFYDKGTCCICVDNLKPATKEQRDQLEKAMADAGYTFDFEKKELNKIEQKHTAEEVLIKAGLKPYKDGDQWCVLLGDNIQEGICGFGNTIEDALYAFLKDLIASQSKQKLNGTFVNVDDVREDFIQEVYRVLDADSTNDRANQIIYAFDNLPTVTIEKQGEQKPTEDVDLEFESYLCLMFQKFRTKGMCTNGEIIDYVKEHSQKLKNILVRPAWSEEDEKTKKVLLEALMTDDAIKILVENAIYYEGAENWLKSLKGRHT